MSNFTAHSQGDGEDWEYLMVEFDRMLLLIKDLSEKENEQKVIASNLREKNINLEDELKHSREQIGRLENLAEDLNRIINEKLEEIYQKTSVLSSFPEYLDSISLQNEALRKENQTLKLSLYTSEENLYHKHDELENKSKEIDCLKSVMELLQSEVNKNLALVIDSNNLSLIGNLRAEIENLQKRNLELEDKIKVNEDKHARIIKQKDLEYNLLKIDYITNLQSVVEFNEPSTPPKPRNGSNLDNKKIEKNDQSTALISKKITITNRNIMEPPPKNNIKKRKYVGDGDTLTITKREIQAANTAIDYHLMH